MNHKKKISIVIPCFNEEDNITHFYKELKNNLSDSFFYEIIFINDGSSDDSLNIIKKLRQDDPEVHYISFSRNFGHQFALKAGFDYASGDCAICMDCDLQHPPHIIESLISKWQEGYQIVNTLRRDHSSISGFKKITSHGFYHFANKLTDVKIEPGVADFRLIDRIVLDQLSRFSENDLFLRALFSWMGFKQATVVFTAGERFAGHSKYTLKKMFHLATTGITAFSVKPLKISMYLGLIFALLAFAYGIYALLIYFFTDKAIAGWTSILISVLFVGGINLLMIGIIGEYLGKLFIENKNRPSYIISETDLEK